MTSEHALAVLGAAIAAVILPRIEHAETLMVRLNASIAARLAHHC